MNQELVLALVKIGFGAIAGGLTPRAVDDKFVIYRGYGDNRQEIAAREDTPVLPGDSIKVKERFF